MQKTLFIALGSLLLCSWGPSVQSFLFDCFPNPFNCFASHECSKDSDCRAKCDSLSLPVCSDHHCRCTKITPAPTHAATVYHDRACNDDTDCSHWFCQYPQIAKCLNDHFLIFSINQKLCCCADRFVSGCDPISTPVYHQQALSTLGPSQDPPTFKYQLRPGSRRACWDDSVCNILECDHGMKTKCIRPFFFMPSVCCCYIDSSGTCDTNNWPRYKIHYITSSWASKASSQYQTNKLTSPIQTNAKTTKSAITTTTTTTTTSTTTTTTTPQPTTGAPCSRKTDCTADNTKAVGPFGVLPCTASDMRNCENGYCVCNSSFLASFTTTQKPSTCFQCGDENMGRPCSARELFDASGHASPCSGDRHYCMTDVHQQNGNIFVYKRCVDEHTCKRQWLQQSSDKDVCLQFNKVSVSGSFDCHFCCKDDGCNSGIKPPNNNTYYVG